MRVILMKRVTNLGIVGDIVEVKNGYGKNYLIPRGFAKVANKMNLRQIENEQKLIESLRAKEDEASKSVAQKLSGIELVIEVRIGETGKLFGSVTSGTIANELKKQGFDIDKKMIELKGHIKAIGDYKVKVKLQAGIEQVIDVKIVPKGKSIEETLKEEVVSVSNTDEKEEPLDNKKTAGSEGEGDEKVPADIVPEEPHPTVAAGK